jgi:hypothetical protein
MDYEEIMLMRADRAKKESKEAIQNRISRQKVISEEVATVAEYLELAQAPGNREW